MHRKIDDSFAGHIYWIQDNAGYAETSGLLFRQPSRRYLRVNLKGLRAWNTRVGNSKNYGCRDACEVSIDPHLEGDAPFGLVDAEFSLQSRVAWNAGIDAARRKTGKETVGGRGKRSDVFQQKTRRHGKSIR